MNLGQLHEEEEKSWLYEYSWMQKQCTCKCQEVCNIMCLRIVSKECNKKAFKITFGICIIYSLDSHWSVI